MGYYTDYRLEITVDDKENEDKILDEIELFIKNLDEEKYLELREMTDGYELNAKWYDYDVDMCYLSYKFPNILFDLYGTGEEYEDAWHATYKNGELIDLNRYEYVNKFKNEKDKINSLKNFYYELLSNQYILYYYNKLKELKLDRTNEMYEEHMEKLIERWLEKYGKN